MTGRQQLPVASPIAIGGLLRGAGAALAGSHGARQRVDRLMQERYHARAAALMDSGTSALTHALRLTAGAGGTVAYPAYNCVDLIAAARFANVRVRLYDIDPHTLSVDLDSLRRVLQEGADAVVIAHLYGFPADVAGARSVAREFGDLPIIEDAAQGIGGTLHGARAGTLGDLSVLSFGRGKGMTGGSGGALLAHTPRWENDVAAAARTLTHAARGIGDVVKTSAAWILGRPSIYRIPASIPALHLGETVYHDAHEPEPLSLAAAAILETSIASADDAIAQRQQHAAALQHAAVGAVHVRAARAIPGGAPGYLRFPVVARATPVAEPRLGIVRGYPRPLADQAELHSILIPSTEPLHGARELAERLLTLPTHHLLTAGDLQRLCDWLCTI